MREHPETPDRELEARPGPAAPEQGSDVANLTLSQTMVRHGAAQALARVRAAAADKGLRPGRGPLIPRDDRGVDRARDGGQSGGAGAHGRDPVLLGDVLGRLLANRGWDADLAIGSIMGRWPAIVGIEVARHTRPERFDRGVLTIRAESSAWAAQLRAYATTVSELIAREVGPEVVLELRIVGPGGPSWRRGPLRVRGRGPRDTYG